MRSCWIRTVAGKTALEFRDVPVPQAGPGEIDLRELHAGRLVVFGVSNSRLDTEGRARTVRGFVRDLLPAFGDGRLTPVIDGVFDFDQLPEAKRYLESNAQVGKIVIRGL